MKYCLSIGALCVIVLLAACAGPSMYSTGAVHRSNPDPEIITTSLFDAKDKTLSEESIQRLLKWKNYSAGYHPYCCIQVW